MKSGDHLDASLGNTNIDDHGGSKVGDGHRAEFHADFGVLGVANQSGDVQFALETQSDGGGTVDGQANRHTGDGVESHGRVEEHERAGHVDFDILGSFNQISEGLGDAGLQIVDGLTREDFAAGSTVSEHTDFRSEDTDEGVHFQVAFAGLQVDALLK